MNIQEIVDTWILHNGRLGYTDDEAAMRTGEVFGIDPEWVKAAVGARYLGREFASRERRDGTPSWEYANGVFPFVEVRGWVLLLPGGVVAEDKTTAKPGFWVKRATASRIRARLAKCMRPAAVAPATRTGSTFTVDANAAVWA